MIDKTYNEILDELYKIYTEEFQKDDDNDIIADEIKLSEKEFEKARV